LGKLTVRRTIVFVGGDFRVLLRFDLTSPFFTRMVQESSVSNKDRPTVGINR
jgi:hypothetical protein